EKSHRDIPLLRGMKWKSDAAPAFATSTDGGTSTSGTTSGRTDGRRGRKTTSVAWTRSPPGPISCAGWPSTTGRRSRNSRGGGPGSKASLRRLIPPLRGTFSPRLPGPLPPSFVVGNVYPPSSVRRRVRLQEAEFGPTFHTHLYTMSTDADKIRALAGAGLDEIRFHVPPGLWSRAADSAFVAASRLARSLGLTVGIEVPLIPEREADLVRLIEWAGAEGLAFVNLNEMEFSDANFPRMKVHGYEMKHELSYGVKGADPVALRILGRKWPTTVHYCTSGYKDGWQL